MKILRFSAVWCLNCIFMRSVWEEISDQFKGLEIFEYDADDQSEIHKQYNIKDVPTVIFLDDSDTEVLRLEGAKDKEELLSAINHQINP